eukprot:3149366-Pyramimonas_sp.AAC.1
MSEEEARGYMNVFTSLSRSDWALVGAEAPHVTTLFEAPGLFCERRELALAPNSEAMLNVGTDLRTSIPFPRTRLQEAEPDEEALRVR